MPVAVKDRLLQGAVAFLAMFTLMVVTTVSAYSDFNGPFFLRFTLFLSAFAFALTVFWPVKRALRSALLWHAGFLIGFGAVAASIRFTAINLVEGVYFVLQCLILVGLLAWTRLAVGSVVKFGDESR